MKEELITFETAKLAKEKGFNIPVLYGVYGKKMKLTWESKGGSFIHVDWNFKTKQQKNSQATAIPTQSLLQKWLREEHNLEVCIKPIGNHSPNEKSYSCVVMTFTMLKGSEHRSYIYEVALEKGLQEALKLIK